jgi:hypothetical protein
LFSKNNGRSKELIGEVSEDFFKLQTAAKVISLKGGIFNIFVVVSMKLIVRKESLRPKQWRTLKQNHSKNGNSSSKTNQRNAGELKMQKNF